MPSLSYAVFASFPTVPAALQRNPLKREGLCRYSRTCAGTLLSTGDETEEYDDRAFRTVDRIPGRLLSWGLGSFYLCEYQNGIPSAVSELRMAFSPYFFS